MLSVASRTSAADRFVLEINIASLRGLRLPHSRPENCRLPLPSVCALSRGAKPDPDRRIALTEILASPYCTSPCSSPHALPNPARPWLTRWALIPTPGFAPHPSSPILLHFSWPFCASSSYTGQGRGSDRDVIAISPPRRPMQLNAWVGEESIQGHEIPNTRGGVSLTPLLNALRPMWEETASPRRADHDTPQASSNIWAACLVGTHTRNALPRQGVRAFIPSSAPPRLFLLF